MAVAGPNFEYLYIDVGANGTCDGEFGVILTLQNYWQNLGIPRSSKLAYIK